MEFGVKTKNRPFRMPPALAGVTKTRTPKTHFIAEVYDQSEYEQVDELLRSYKVLPGDTISYVSNNQQGAWSAKVVIRGKNKKLGPIKYLYNDYAFFGRKGDAKRAMRIHHREGISLKAAWKRVLGKSKKTAKKKTSGLTKTQRLAKKAMKLHHSKGIPLKKAWKMVQKFGTTADMYNPPGLVDYEFNPETGKYRKRCKDYQYRSADGRCRGRKPVVPPPGKEINPETGRLRKICEPPKMRNLRGRCVGPRKDLKPGYVINPRTGRAQLASKEGYYRDPMTNRWRKIPRIAGDYTPSNSYRNIDRIRRNIDPVRDLRKKNVEPVDISDYDDDDIFMVFGKKKFKCGFGGCSACTLKNNFGKKKSVMVKKSISLADLQGIARANGVSLTECKELGKTRLQAKLKKMGLLNKKEIDLDYNTIPFTFFGKKLKFGTCHACSKK